VSSVLELSTTMISSAGLLCLDSSMRHVFSIAASLRLGITTETVGTSGLPGT
jgi:hypothetical protein